ncbi:MAG TPA: NAD(P)-dependent oxidoreductase [Solirubrobacteraceae bacterium]|nr:NAD(P)-dependent oxidoreductase [Solirubrobacteraceae bacterium]
MSRRVLVTGATGFIGRGSLAPLLAAGAEVHALSSRGASADDGSGVSWHAVDLLSEDAARAVAEIGADELLHFAWYAEPGRFWRSERNLDWVRASLSLLRAFAQAGGRRAVFAGSCAEYAWEDETECVEAVTPCVPATLYGAAKHGLHTIAAAYARESGVSLAWGRIFFVFGPHEDRARLGGSVASALVSGEPALCSHGEQVRDFIYAPELAAAFVALLGSEVQGAVNMASGRPLRIRDLVEALGRAAGRPDLIRLGARPAGSEPTRLTADVTRLREEVGWAPGLDLKDAAHETIRWWRGTLR